MNKLSIAKEIFVLIDALTTGSAMSMPKADQYAFELEVNLDLAMSGKRNWTPLINEAYDIGYAIESWEDQKARKAFLAEQLKDIQATALSNLLSYKTSVHWKSDYLLNVAAEISIGDLESAQDMLDCAEGKEMFGDMPYEVFRILGKHTGVTELSHGE